MYIRSFCHTENLTCSKRHDDDEKIRRRRSDFLLTNIKRRFSYTLTEFLPSINKKYIESKIRNSIIRLLYIDGQSACKHFSSRASHVNSIVCFSPFDVQISSWQRDSTSSLRPARQHSSDDNGTSPGAAR